MPLPRARSLLRPGLLAGAGALLLLLWALVAGWPPAIVAPDVDQQRLDSALPVPGEGSPISQTFRSQHDGLNEVEILLARSGDGARRAGRLTLQLLDESGALVAGQSWAAADLVHNQSLALRFPAQRDSEGQRYTLVLRSSGENPFSAWAYGLDVYDDGRLQGAGGEAQELRFTSHYQLTAGSALRELGRLLGESAPILLLASALMFMPGCLLLLLAGPRLPRLARGAWWGLALALGLAAWPLLWLWPTLLGMAWARWSLAVLLAGGWLIVATLFVARRGPGSAALFEGRPRRRRRAAGGRLAPLLLAGLLALALGVRLLAVRDLDFPPWVDSSRHALITAVMADDGQVISDYDPYLPVEQFPYHFGFHSLAATLVMLTGWPLPRTLLHLGQLLNGMVVLSIYSAVWLLARRRGAALLGAFLVALPFFFPAYYATWGRFTQLAGVGVLPPLLALTWLVVRGARGWRSAWWLVGLLAAGLSLIHFRVFLLYVPFAALVGLLGLWRRAQPLLGATLLGLLLAGPRLLQLARMADETWLFSEAGDGYARFPGSYLQVGWERAFLLLGGLAFVAAVIGALRGRRWALLPVVLGGWAGLVALLLSGRVPGLPAIWLINLNSAYILSFVPLALLLALAFARLWRFLRRRRAGWQALAGLALGAALAAAALFGARQQVDILNRATILTRPGDLQGLRWLDHNLPPDARVAVNSWQWLGQTWAGSDGGAWITPLSARHTTTPPPDYAYDPGLFVQVMQFNQKAMAIEDWSDPEAAQWLRGQGVTHIFAGARGGFLDPAALARNPQLEMVYGRQGVFIFAFP